MRCDPITKCPGLDVILDTFGNSAANFVRKGSTARATQTLGDGVKMHRSNFLEREKPYKKVPGVTFLSLTV